MPITLAPISRRGFLAGSLAAGAGLVLGPQWLGGAEIESDPNRFALLSDTHIAADRSAHERGVTMADHLEHVRGELLRLDPRPAAVLVNGDCAYHAGKRSDYRTFLELVRPIREHGLPMHLAMGNHDNRQHLWAILPADEAHAPTLPDRQIVVFESPWANWFMLDSLDRTNHTPGVLGQPQIGWLKSELDRRRDKPAIVLVHHQPDHGAHPSGLVDTKALLDALIPRKQVKALLYGHTHVWSVTALDGLHCINLPAVAYVFSPEQPSGWVDCHVRDGGMSLELRCIDTSHSSHGERHDLIWRD